MQLATVRLGAGTSAAVRTDGGWARLPGDDLVSDLVAHDCDGRGLTAEEIHAIVADCLAAAAQTA